ncbi:MAG: aldo/keto reductase [Thiobacillus sp.]|nr:aldo/keto reductase [Thiobacillus sp.]
MSTIFLGNSSLSVPSVCLGTMTFGEQNSESDAHAQMNYALAQGVNFIDTAEMYPVPARAETAGLTERFVGTWLKHQSRDRIVLATKATGPGRTLSWIREGQLNFSRENLRQALDGSLRRLQTDYVDLYQLHWPDRNVPMFGSRHFDPDQERETVPWQETLTAVADFIKSGRIRHWGLSNETPWGVMMALRLADALGLPRPVSVQNAYSLLNRTWENGLAEIGFREHISLLAYSPLGFGALSGKYLDDPASPGRMNLFAGFGLRYGKPNTAPAVAAYAALARQHGLTPTQLALGFVYGRRCVGSTIIGATTMAQLQENLAAREVRLSPDILAGIERIDLRFTNPAP